MRYFVKSLLLKGLAAFGIAASAQNINTRQIEAWLTNQDRSALFSKQVARSRQAHLGQDFLRACESPPVCLTPDKVLNKKRQELADLSSESPSDKTF